jgi:hypothetical protein
VSSEALLSQLRARTGCLSHNFPLDAFLCEFYASEHLGWGIESGVFGFRGASPEESLQTIACGIVTLATERKISPPSIDS